MKRSLTKDDRLSIQYDPWLWVVFILPVLLCSCWLLSGNQDLWIIFPCQIALFVTLGVLFLYSESFASQEQHKGAWLNLADKHKLHFYPARFPSQRAIVRGSYHNFHVELKTVDGSTLVNMKQSMRYLEQIRQKVVDTPSNLIAQHHLVDMLTILNKLRAYGIQISQDGQHVSCTIHETEISLTQLETFLDTQIEVIEAYTPFIAIGGEAVQPLRQVMVKHYGQVGLLAAAIIRAISSDTSSRFANSTDRLLCPDCLTRFESRRVKMIGEKDVHYYGCRTCGQSRRTFTGRVELVLDQSMQGEQVEIDHTLRLNWLRSKRLADVHKVEISQASDQDVERLVMQVQNDTTPGRRTQYAQLTCTIDPSCYLSENSLRLLHQIFQNVEQPDQRYRETP